MIKPVNVIAIWLYFNEGGSKEFTVVIASMPIIAKCVDGIDMIRLI